MAIRNADWYNENESRAYPLDDDATGVDNSGSYLPQHIICDLHLALPNTLGRHVFLSSVTVSPGIVTVTLLASEDPDSAATVVPVASVSLPKPIDQYRLYPLQALYPGVGGWIAFGGGTEESYSGRFSTPAQARVIPQAIKPYTPLPVTSIGKLHNATPLTGLVQLLGDSDIEIVKECREVPAYPPASSDACVLVGDEPDLQARDVIVFRLVDTNDQGVSRNVFDIYRGPCSNRPESFNCGEPAPIEFLGPVSPDCCGVITIEMRGCARLSAIVEAATIDSEGDLVESHQACGVVIDCSIGLAEACITADHLPSAEGVLPNEYQDLCESISSISLPPDVDEEEEESFSLDEDEESENADPALPIYEDFADVSDWDLQSGQFVLSGGAYGTTGDGGHAMRSVTVYDVDYPTYYKKVSARGRLLIGPSGALHNMAVIANYKETGDSTGHFAYWVAEIDWDGHYQGFKLFRIGRFNGIRWSTVLAVPVSTLALEDYYDITLTIYPKEDPNDAWMIATLKGVDDPTIDIEIGPVSVSNFGLDDGKFGLGTNRSVAQFTSFALENSAET